MSKDFVEIKPEEISGNTFKLFGVDWPLITSGSLGAYNSMTAGWGGFGVVWKKNVASITVRPQRHTFGFLEKEPYFSLSFFDKKYKDVLNFFGTKSGKDVDKVKETGITPIEDSNKVVYYKEASLVLILKKIFSNDINPEKFINFNYKEIYPDKDYHRLYIGEIVKVLVKK
jgi:flavin reductase (DIM6/NTAB) family NADH-FMN oxidoreductase RutF